MGSTFTVPQSTSDFSFEKMLREMERLRGKHDESYDLIMHPTDLENLAVECQVPLPQLPQDKTVARVGSLFGMTVHTDPHVPRGQVLKVPMPLGITPSPDFGFIRPVPIPDPLIHTTAITGAPGSYRAVDGAGEVIADLTDEGAMILASRQGLLLPNEQV